MTEKLRKGLLDFSIILLMPILASILSLALKLNAMWSVILFFVLPSLYLSFRIPSRVIWKTILFSAIASIPTIIMVDYIAHLTGQWLIPHSILPFRLFGYVTLEVISWAFFNFIVVILFYERFLDAHVTKKLYSPKIKWLILLILSLISIFTVAFISNQVLVKFPYFYLSFGLAFLLLPTATELLRYHGLTSRFFKAGIYFFFLTFLYEVTALKLDWWRFPSNQFVGWISVMGVRFPFEEFLFWLVLFAMAILTAFEKFDDDKEKKYL